MIASPHTQAVALQDLRTVLFAHKLRRRTDGKLASLAVTTPSPFLEVDCGGGLRHLAGMRTEALRIGHWKSRVQPLQRGHIARLIDRVQATGGRTEVHRTWHTGIGQLRREPRYALHLPLLAHTAAKAWA